MSQTMKKEGRCACHSGEVSPMHPRPFRIMKIWQELSDTFSMALVPEDGCAIRFAPGQFNMLYVFGVGEIPISVSGDPSDVSVLVHTTRAVGSVSKALGSMREGDIVGVRGPFGSEWPLDVAEGKDVVFVAGGIGLAPLRPAIYQALARRHKHRNIAILYGARTPEDILYPKELLRWKARFDIDVQVTVDRSTGDWSGRVGLVTKLVESGGFDPSNAVAYTCGPEVMMLHVVDSLHKKGVPDDHIYLSMERNMKCGIGFCGHCQWGSFFVCRDGPVFRYDQIADSLKVREL